MKTVDGGNTLQFDVIGYEYPKCKKSKPDAYNYDANRLTLKVTYTTPDGVAEYTDSRLLTEEPDRVISGIDNLIRAGQSCYISDFMEPGLILAIGSSGKHTAPRPT